MDVLKAVTVQQLAAGIDGLSKCVGEIVAGTVYPGNTFSASSPR
ncbi:MAG: hypothetical protein R3C20_15225 [Planctomycetaceae bacterium]